ncbi:sulfotransferase domain-containing protein [Mangrovimonas futianensis]|uniref:sulfotransferase domain-containing protein n=1 Tax=Mangrovimonas futianensis TaxID=2895523 RepID=UPI001E462611|nr:sulfotransferase domain-containing protein [Mangrovimonas futianensis]MCF1420928.1 sulfotransferase domain-containing protein [Mangrovimonas futianensis]
MKAKNQLDKFKYYLIKRKDVFLHSLKSSQRIGAKIGPKVILNSMPKSGTHLLESLFFQLPLMRHCGRKTLKIETQNPLTLKLKIISSVKKGQFLLSHMQYHEDILNVSRENNIKIVHLIRDPRDVLISHLNYIEKMDKTQKSHQYLNQFDMRFDKLKAIVDGREHIIEPFKEVLNKFYPWTQESDVNLVKFESLIGVDGGGSSYEQKTVVKRICDFLSIEVSENQLDSICKEIYSIKSSTFNKGKIGSWKVTLNEEEQNWINTVLQNEIEKYGYGHQ